jgi:hypothetical protein
MNRLDKINTYNDLLNALKDCKGGVVQIIYDSEPVNRDLIKSFTNDLDEYKVIDFNELDIDIPDNQSIFGRKARVIIKMRNDNYVLIVLKRYYRDLTGNFSAILGDKLAYEASLILLLQNKKLKILKWRFGLNNYKYDFDINVFVRKIKLKTLNQKNNI